MKKSKLTLLALSALILASCGGSTSSSLPTDKPTDIPTVAPTETPTEAPTEAPTETPTEQVSEKEGEVITLKTFGELYKGGFRSIYASLSSGDDEDIVWTTTDENVVTVSARPENTREAFITGKGVGTATITATLAGYTNSASIDITIIEGEAMPLDLYKSLSESVKFTTNDYLLSFNKNFEARIDEQYTYETIYEEYKPAQGYLENSTDGYAFKAYNVNKGELENDFTYVRSDNGKVATEYLDMYNRLRYEEKANEDGELVSWENTLYKNPLVQKQYITNENFRTFDHGETYHFVGNDIGPDLILASLTLVPNLTPDDLYIKKTPEGLKLCAFIEPYSADAGAENIRWGRYIEGNITDIGTAKVNHVTPFEKKDYHDEIINAVNNITTNKNYTVEYTLTYPESTKDNLKYVYTFTKDGLHEVKYAMENGVFVEQGQNGLRTTDGSAYYHYEINKETHLPILIKEFNSGWETGKHYPNFNFAPEIFEKTGDNTFKTISNHGMFITRCLYLNNAFAFYEYPNPGTLTLGSDGNIANINTTVVALDEPLIVDANFSKVGSSTIDIDFSTLEKPADPTSWKEHNPDLYGEMVKWKIDEAVPFLYAAPGWDSFIGKKLVNEQIKYVYFDSNYFNTLEESKQFIKDYQAALVAAGFTATGAKESETGYELYSKGAYMIGIGNLVTWWNNRETEKVEIIVLHPNLIDPNR